MSVLSFLKQPTPKKQNYGIRGDFQSWAAALSASSPYQTNLQVYHGICERIRRGEHTSGRNIMPLLSAIALIREPARILDFGGNLGMMYFEMAQLAPDKIESWHVVDLQEVVDCGNAGLADRKLKFVTDWRNVSPNIVLCAHTLQYLEKPYEMLSVLLMARPEVLVLHELPVASETRFAVQDLMPELGGGCRPMQILSENLLAGATQGYALLSEITLPALTNFPNTRQVARIYRRVS